MPPISFRTLIRARAGDRQALSDLLRQARVYFLRATTRRLRGGWT